MPSDSTDTRSLLTDAAIAVFSANPTATLADVASAAGVKRVTLHRLFGSRDALLQAIAIRSHEEMDAACERAAKGAKSHTAALRAIVAALVPVGDRFHFLWTQHKVWEDAQVAKRVAQDNAELTQLIDAAKAEGGIATEVPTPWVLAAIEATVFAALTASRRGDIAVNDAGQLAVDTLFDGIRRSKYGKTSRGKKT